MILEQFPDKNTFCRMAEHYNVIPACTRILADTHTPVSILNRLYHQNRPLFLLESVEGGEKWARYSFLGISIKESIQVFKDWVEINSGKRIRRISHGGNPLQILRELTAAYRPAPFMELPRVWCGMTGYISYEMASFFEDITLTLPDEKAYAHFIIPDEIIIFDNMKHTMTCTGIAFIDRQSDVADEYGRVCRKVETTIQTIQMADASIHIGKQHDALEKGDRDISLNPEMEPEEFSEKVNRVKKYIIEGDIIQAVISQKFSADTYVDPLMLYRAQRYVNPSPYMFFMHFGDMTIAGSSPETMVRMENAAVTLRPIAGTRKRGETEAEDMALADDLLNDEKERAEHLMLVDLGRNDLGRIAGTGSVQVTDLMFVEKYSHVMHLVSNIRCDLKKDKDAWDIIKACFPAGTLSGAPKIRAMEIISTVEKKYRDVYGGAAGYISFSGDMDLAIAIRTAVMENNSISVRAGAGIVYDSDPEKEYQECINKARSVETALKLAISSKG